MNDAPRESDAVDVVEVRIEIAARRETIFAFLSDPDAFRRWMGQGSSLAGVGGPFRVAYPNGDVAAGVVEEIVPNERIVLSWGYEGSVHGVAPGTTRVEISLTESPGGTRVVLRHTGLRDAARRAQHRMGWRHYLATLSQLASASLDVVAEQRIDRYTAAWAELDASARRDLLAQCWEEDGVFRDPMGYAEGRADLSDHIGAAQQFSRGMTLERVGPVSRAHAFVSYRWRIVASDGKPVMTGSNIAELSGEGLIRSMTGFWDAAGQRA